MKHHLLLTLLTLIASVASFAFAHHFTGTYQDPQSGTTIQIQHGTDGRLQGVLAGPNGQQLPFQGMGNQQGAYGQVRTPQAVFGFQAQVSPDLQMLQFVIFQFDQQGRPVQASARPLTLRRVQAGFPPGNGAPFPPGGGFPPPPGGGFPPPPGGGFPPPPGGGFPPPGNGFPVPPNGFPPAPLDGAPGGGTP